MQEWVQQLLHHHHLTCNPTLSHKPDVQKLNKQNAWLRLSAGNVIWHETWGDKAMVMTVADAAAAAVVVMSKVYVKDWSLGSRRRHFGIMGRWLFRNVPR